MGLGDIKVSSYLDQPFSADIELIDVGNTPLSGIKANLASVADFERAGLERAYALSLLAFSVETHADGKAFVSVRSTERITDPFMQLLIDLAWSEGQVYRSYTVLLDPPNYQISVVKNQLKNIVNRQYASQSKAQGGDGNIIYDQVKPSSNLENRNVATYGPTIASETIWQIAQHYKAGDVSLQQIILAIVGTNPDAFIEGNLNGLKDGSLLHVPASSAINKVPLSVAKFEVLAHDKAWQTRKPIEHVLLPPYIDTATAAASGSEQASYPLSSIPPVPTFDSMPEHSVVPSLRFFPLMPSFLSGGDYVATNGMSQSKSLDIKQGKTNADVRIAAAAIESIREVNALLIKEMQKLRADNKRLQQQVTNHSQEMKKLRHQLHILLKRQGISSPISEPSHKVQENSILPWLLIVLVLAGGGFAYWKLWILPRRNHGEEPTGETTPSLEPVVPQSSELPSSVDETEANPIITEAPQTLPSENQDFTDSSAAILPTTPLSDEDKPELSNEEQPAELSTDDIESITIVGESEQILDFEPQDSVEDSDAASPISPLSSEDDLLLDEIVYEPTEQASAVEDEPQQDISAEDSHVFEYEPVPVVKPAESEESISESNEMSVQDDNDNGIDFVLNPVEQSPASKEALQPLKSKAALDTLLALAKTYIGMDDTETARQSLQEVLDFGSKAQKAEAKRLLDELDKM